MKRALLFAFGVAAAVLLVSVKMCVRKFTHAFLQMVQFVCVVWDVFKPVRRRSRRIY